MLVEPLQKQGCRGTCTHPAHKPAACQKGEVGDHRQWLLSTGRHADLCVIPDGAQKSIEYRKIWRTKPQCHILKVLILDEEGRHEGREV